jgi:hypothetical protein
MHNRQGLTPSLLLSALLDYDLWPIYLLGLTWSIPATPITAYITLNLKALGFNTFQTNLLTVPAYVLFLIQLIFWTWLSERLKGNTRFFIVLVSQIWMLPLVLALELLSAKASPWIWYSVTILLVGYPYIHAILGLSSPLPGVIELLTRVGSRNYLAQCRLRPHPHSRQRAVQHVRASQQHHLVQCTSFHPSLPSCPSLYTSLPYSRCFSFPNP